MFKSSKKKNGGGKPEAMELAVIKGGTNILLGGAGGDPEDPPARPLTELEKVRKEKEQLEREIKDLRRLVDEKALDNVEKTEADKLVSSKKGHLDHEARRVP